MSSEKFSNSKNSAHMITIGERIAQIRVDHNKMKSAFADSLGWSRPQVTKYESNTETPGIDKLIKMADRYQVNLHWLITGKGEQYISNPYLFIVPGTALVKDKAGHYQMRTQDGSLSPVDDDMAKVHVVMQSIYKRINAADKPLKKRLITILDNISDLIETIL